MLNTTMTEYRIYFHPAQSDTPELATIMDIRAAHMEMATNTAQAWLVMMGKKFAYCEIFEKWKSMWRSTGHRIDNTPNL